MPIKIPNQLPAAEILNKENIFVMPEERAAHQDIRPLRMAVMNLMPTKIVTETQLLRLLGNSPLQVEVALLHPRTHMSKNTPEEHLAEFYRHFDEIADENFDGLVITGAPVEQLDFEAVDYWEELQQLMDWSVHHVFSTFHICWAAQAGLYHHFAIPKYALPEKIFGVFSHRRCKDYVKLLRGFDDEFFAPHSRHTNIDRSDLDRVPQLEVLAESDEAGPYIVASKDGRQIFVTGHAEYDPMTLKAEYDRDIAKGMTMALPKNYFPDNDPTRVPLVKWRGHANLLFSNWLNYYVYQETPFDLKQLGPATSEATPAISG